MSDWPRMNCSLAPSPKRASESVRFRIELVRALSDGPSKNAEDGEIVDDGGRNRRVDLPGRSRGPAPCPGYLWRPQDHVLDEADRRERVCT